MQSIHRCECCLFDLDDTLYPEREFVKSGFRTVAGYLGKHFGLDEEHLLAKQLDILRSEGRGHVFDRLLQEINCFERYRVAMLVYLYRCHVPAINLYKDVLPAMQTLRERGIKLGIITDGMASVQRRKIKALNLSSLVDIIICTGELGEGGAKPSTIPYQVALDLLQTEPCHAVYVGNDPSKDFAGANKLGMLSVRIRRKDSPAEPDISALPEIFKPAHAIENLEELIALIGGEDNE